MRQTFLFRSQWRYVEFSSTLASEILLSSQILYDLRSLSVLCEDRYGIHSATISSHQLLIERPAVLFKLKMRGFLHLLWKNKNAVFFFLKKNLNSWGLFLVSDKITKNFTLRSAALRPDPALYTWVTDRGPGCFFWNSAEYSKKQKAQVGSVVRGVFKTLRIPDRKIWRVFDQNTRNLKKIRGRLIGNLIGHVRLRPARFWIRSSQAGTGFDVLGNL